MVYAIIAVVLLLIFAGFHVWHSRKKEKQKAYHQKLREKALTESLKNSRGENLVQSMEQVLEQERLIERNQILVRLTVSGRQNKDYVLSPQKEIGVGKIPGENDLVVDGENMKQKLCKIFLFQNQVYLQKLDLTCPVVIRRKNNQMNLKGQAVRILTGDKIQIGGFRIMVSLMDYVGNTIQG
ncbi:hypothetical protein VSQ48_01995 [Candidatus Ventrimonas sp. KK005]